MKSKKKKLSATNKTLARVLSLVYVVLAAMILNGTLVLNSSITERPFWLSSQDSMSTLTFIALIVVIVMNMLTKWLLFFPFWSKYENKMDDRQKLIRRSSLAKSYWGLFLAPYFMWLYKEQIGANLTFVQDQGGLVFPFWGITFLIIGLPSAIAAWHRDI